MKQLTLILVILVQTWLSCSHDAITGGSGTETTDSFAYLESGAPASHCTVLLIDQSGWVDHATTGEYIVDSATASADGLFSFKNTGLYRRRLLSIQIDHDSAGLCRKSMSLDDLDSTTFVLGRYSRMTGTLNNAAPGTALRIDGTTYSTAVQSDGSFSFNTLPQGDWAVIAEDPEGLHSVGTVPVPADTVIDATFDNQWNNRFLLTDFECGFTSPLAEASGITPFWYLFSDSTAKGYTFETGQWVIDNADDFTKSGNSSVTADVKPGESGGMALFVNGTLDQQSSFPYLGIGLVTYTEGNNGIDLRTATAIEFDVYGTGTMRLIFLAKHPQYATNVRFATHIPLPSEPEHIAIDLSTLSTNTPTDDTLYASWSEVSRHVLMMEFAFYDSENSGTTEVDATIDNITFAGTDLRRIRSK